METFSGSEFYSDEISDNEFDSELNEYDSDHSYHSYLIDENENDRQDKLLENLKEAISDQNINESEKILRKIDIK